MQLPVRVMQALSLEHQGAWYPTLVLDFEEGRRLTVGVPQEKGEAVAVGVDEVVTVDVLLPDGIRRFRTVVLRVAEAPPSLVLAWPKELEKIQRRDWFRVNVDLRAEVTFQEEGMRDRRGLVGSAIDLSGGGARLALPEPVSADTLMQLHLTVPGAGTLSCPAKVVRWGERPGATPAALFWVACEFVEPSEAFRKDVMKFVFDIQREQMRKGIV